MLNTPVQAATLVSLIHIIIDPSMIFGQPIDILLKISCNILLLNISVSKEIQHSKVSPIGFTVIFFFNFLFFALFKGKLLNNFYK